MGIFDENRMESRADCLMVNKPEHSLNLALEFLYVCVFGSKLSTNLLRNMVKRC